MLGAVISVVLGVIAVIAAFTKYFHSFNRLMPRAIFKGIWEHGSSYTVHLRKGDHVWDPAHRIGSAFDFGGPGAVTYWLDESKIVHARLQSRDGSERESSGPIPKGFDLDDPNLARNRKKVRKALRMIVAVYALFAAGGFGSGYALTTGSDARHIGVGALGTVCGYITAYLVQHAVVVVVMVRKALRKDTPGGPASVESE